MDPSTKRPAFQAEFHLIVNGAFSRLFLTLPTCVI